MSWGAETTDGLRARVGPATVVAMALGAIEQHGPHLPLDTDTTIAAGLLTAAQEHLPEDFPLLTLPPQAVGASDEHASYPGTLSLGAGTLVATLEAIGEGVARAGGRRLVWLNGHGGNRAAMDVAGLALRRRFGLLVVKCSYNRLGLPDGAPAVPDSGRGFHGGWLETALMLALAPAHVRRQAAQAFEARHIDGRRTSLVSPEGPAPFAWLAEDLNPAGVIGRAADATARDGERLVAFYAERIARVLIETSAVSLPLAGALA